MQLTVFLQDLAATMAVAGVVTLIFYQMKQPVVLGYIIAGVILGPHTPPFALIQDENTVKTLADLGVLFLMFSLGLEFNIKKLFRVGLAAAVAALSEIVFMTFIGYELGQFFGWNTLDSLFLGAMLSISSTIIIIKALYELGMSKEHFAQITFGILIIEDILAIAILALLSSVSVDGEINTLEVITTLGKLLMFLVSSLIIGILIVPKFISYVSQLKRNEILLISVLGLCFGFCWIVMQLDYSVALGAFIIGAIMAESKEIHAIEKLIDPLKNMFSAIFFVSIGLLVDPSIIMQYKLEIAIITLIVILGKIITCGFGVFIAGKNGQDSVRVGMSLAQIGEFSFIIASLGISLKVTSAFLYPIIVSVSAITTLITPYLIRFSDPCSGYLSKASPSRLATWFNRYSLWMHHQQAQNKKSIIIKLIKKSILQIFVNSTLVAAIFFLGFHLAKLIQYHAPIYDHSLQNTFIWGSALTLSLPFLIAIYRKLKALSMILVEMLYQKKFLSCFPSGLSRAIYETLPIIAMLILLLSVTMLSIAILPPLPLLSLVLLFASTLLIVLWKWFVKIHAYLQTLFLERITKRKNRL